MRDIFYFTDIHGMYDLYRAAIDYCLEQDPECTIIYGGDACDRGPAGYKIMKELLDNPQVIYLKGNHEDMFVNAAREIKKDYTGQLNEKEIHKYLYDCEIYGLHSYDAQLSLYNGSYPTLRDWMLDGMPEDFIKQIDNLFLIATYENIDFCHAGGHYKNFSRVFDCDYKGININKNDYMMIIWDRNYLSCGWDNDRICVFGHTPVIHLPAKYYGQDKSKNNAHPCAYIGMLDDRYNGKKIDMDTCTVFSGRLYVLNCLTMKAQGFFDKDFENNAIGKHQIEKIECIIM